MSEVICHEEEDWDVSVPKKESEGLLVIKARKKICVDELLRSIILVETLDKVKR